MTKVFKIPFLVTITHFVPWHQKIFMLCVTLTSYIFSDTFTWVTFWFFFFSAWIFFVQNCTCCLNFDHYKIHLYMDFCAILTKWPQWDWGDLDYHLSGGGQHSKSLSSFLSQSYAHSSVKLLKLIQMLWTASIYNNYDILAIYSQMDRWLDFVTHTFFNRKNFLTALALNWAFFSCWKSNFHPSRKYLVASYQLLCHWSTMFHCRDGVFKV